MPHRLDRAALVERLEDAPHPGVRRRVEVEDPAGDGVEVVAGDPRGAGVGEVAGEARVGGGAEDVVAPGQQPHAVARRHLQRADGTLGTQPCEERRRGAVLAGRQRPAQHTLGDVGLARGRGGAVDRMPAQRRAAAGDGREANDRRGVAARRGQLRDHAGEEGLDER